MKYIIKLAGPSTNFENRFYTGSVSSFSGRILKFSEEYPNAKIFTLSEANEVFNSIAKSGHLDPQSFLEIVRDYGLETEETVREEFTA